MSNPFSRNVVSFFAFGKISLSLPRAWARFLFDCPFSRASTKVIIDYPALRAITRRYAAFRGKSSSFYPRKWYLLYRGFSSVTSDVHVLTTILGTIWSRSRESGNLHRLRKTIFLVLFSLLFFFFLLHRTFKNFIYLLGKVHRDPLFLESFQSFVPQCFVLDARCCWIVNDFYSVENFIEDETEIR